VTIGGAFAAGRMEVTRGQYAAFARETGRPAQGSCYYFSGAQDKYVNDDPAKDWTSPGFAQADDHPVVCVTWDDAQAYAQWLSRKTGKPYRLLTEAEWEYAARAYSSTARPWGEDSAQACSHAVVQDESFARSIAPTEGRKWLNHNCDDGSVHTTRVGRYAANRFGLHDMIGNAFEWVEDCWNPNYTGAPSDGAAWIAGKCARRVVRGGSWNNNPRNARSAIRDRGGFANRINYVGFRLASTFKRPELVRLRSQRVRPRASRSRHDEKARMGSSRGPGRRPPWPSGGGGRRTVAALFGRDRPMVH